MIEIIIGESGVGKTTYLKKELLRYNKKDVVYLPQEVAGIFNPLKTIYYQIFEINFNLKEYHFLLKKLALNSLNLKRYPHEFSTGELQRFALLIIFLKPSIKKIFLDEPTSNLDLANQSILVEILRNIKIPMLISTHNLDFATKLTKNIKNIKMGELSNLKEKYIKADDFWSKLEKNYVKKADNNENFNFLQASSQITLILGKSGYGKTSILHKMNAFLIKSNIKTVFLSQNYAFSLSPQRRILKTLFEALNFRDKNFLNSKADIKEIIKIFRKLKLSNKLLKKFPHELSLGEKQRILIIRAILLKYPYILLDEPTSSLDIENEKKMIQFLFFIQKEYNMSFIIVSHSQYVINILLNKATTVLFFKEQFKYYIYQNNILK